MCQSASSFCVQESFYRRLDSVSTLSADSVSASTLLPGQSGTTARAEMKVVTSVSRRKLRLSRLSTSVMLPLHSPVDPEMSVGSNQILTTNERRTRSRVFTFSEFLLRAIRLFIMTANLCDGCPEWCSTRVSSNVLCWLSRVAAPAILHVDKAGGSPVDSL